MRKAAPQSIQRQMPAMKLVDWRRKERVCTARFEVDTGYICLLRGIDNAKFFLRADKNATVEAFAKAEISTVINAGFVFVEVYDQRGAAIRKSALLCM